MKEFNGLFWSTERFRCGLIVNCGEMELTKAMTHFEARRNVFLRHVTHT
jgi:hypothetical protein